MGLVLPTTHKGITCEYWRIERIKVMYRNEGVDKDDLTEMHVQLTLYVNKISRTVTVNNWLTIKTYIFPHHIKVGVNPQGKPIYDVYMPDKDDRMKIYKVLKKLPEFEGAEDA